ncbi:MAG: xanthine dehydrogenase accessory protein XdhC [Comamonadaceae bacterium]|jgi:xanthine dehydrogenase accessory factor
MSLDKFLLRLAVEPACLMTVHASRGSVPREKGAWMAVFAEGALGTIGGGHLEFAAMAQARECLVAGLAETVIRYPLGPTLGQCCGGELQLRFEVVTATDIGALRERLTIQHPALALFGGGHVGQALVQVLARLPLKLTWIDSRDEIFPPELPAGVVCQHSDPVQSEVACLAPGSRVLIMSFSHAEDLEVVAACLTRQRLQADLPYVGLIGSKTKWATFGNRLAARGFAAQEIGHVTCPIGIPGIDGKEPEVIAVAVAAQLLLSLSDRR